MFGKKLGKNLPTISPDGKSTSIISTGTSIKGDIHAEGSLRLDGTIYGDCIVKQRLVLGIGSSITGNVTAKSTEISGIVTGTLKIDEISVLKSTSKINGTLYTRKLVIEEGAYFNGECSMGDPTNKAENKSPNL